MNKEELKKKFKNDPANKALDLMLDSQKNLKTNWDKLYNYMKPFFEGDSDLAKSAEAVQKEISLQPTHTMVFATAMTAKMLAVDMFKPEFICGKCKEKIITNSGEEQ